MEEKDGLQILREKFPDNLISQLPKPACSNDEWKKLPKGRCNVCGGYHATSKTIHLSYVGHAALTDRLLDADHFWSWEPLALDDNGLPFFDTSGGLWIKLTVCGVTRIGYGNAKPNKFAEVGSREKEVIGDALRNAAMRFGAALELWHKGDLHVEPPESEEEKIKKKEQKGNTADTNIDDSTLQGWKDMMGECDSYSEMLALFDSHVDDIKNDCGVKGYNAVRKHCGEIRAKRKW